MAATPASPSAPEVPPPIPPDDPEAWYAPDVRAQYAVHPGVVATVRETETGFRYEVREPPLSPAEAADRERVADYLADAATTRPRTREGTQERVAGGLGRKFRRVVDRLTDGTRDGARRIEYYVLRDVRALGELTPLALDDRIEVADAASDHLVVHTADFAPARTDLPADPPHLDRFASERVARYTVPFHGFRLPVTVYRERVLGTDPFAVKYAVEEPSLLPGDEALLAACKERIWEGDVGAVVDDRAAFVRERAREFLARQLTAANTRAWLEAARFRLRRALSAYGLALPPLDERFADDRLSDLVYYVLRDFVGEGALTVPIRDPHLEDVEANRVGERIKVVPRADLGVEGRVPTNLAFEDATAFENVATKLAAGDGSELTASNPSAKVNLQPADVPDGETIRCAVALPVISEGGPHVSIRKQSPDAMTPVDLLERESVSTAMVALCWLAYEHRGVVLFSGPTGVGKTTLMNAHMPFVPFDHRPISIDEGSREVRLPHETGVSLTTRVHESEFKRVTMADLMTEANYLNPDVEVIAEINTPASFETFAETLNTGHGVIGTTHAESVEKLVNRVIEQGLPAYLLRELDLLVFPKRVDGERYVGRIVEIVDAEIAADLDGRGGVVEKGDTEIHYNVVAWRDPDGTFRFAGDESEAGDVAFFEALAERTDSQPAACRRAFERKRRYVEYLEREGFDDFEDLFGFLSDLQTDEAATVERASAADAEGPARDAEGAR